MRKPLCIDLFCGLGGWTDGFLEEGYNVVGFDIEIRPYPAQLVIQDVLTIHGSQFKDAAVIVASPPCQKYSYLAMPWSRSKSNHSQAAKALRHKWETEGPDNRLFDACFRIQREASEAAGHHIPLVVENVRGAIPWVGRSAWNYGSFHLWADVPALMPIRLKVRNGNERNDARDDASGSSGCISVCGGNTGGMRTPSSVLSGVGLKGRNGGGWFGDARGNVNRKQDPRDVRKQADGSWETPDGTNITVQDDTKSSRQNGGWFNDYKGEHCVGISRTGSRSEARKAASAQIAKIPIELARHIAAVYKPRERW